MTDFTALETEILLTLKDILNETECIYSDDLVRSNPKKLRGALASLVSKRIIDVEYDYPSRINGVVYYPINWDEEVINSI